MNRQEIFELVQKYNEGKCTPEEKILLETWYVNKNELYHDELLEAEMELALNDVYDSLPRPPKKTKLWPAIFMKVAAVLGLLVFGLWFFRAPHQLNVSKDNLIYTKDIAPGKSSATLTLANGKTIDLSEAKEGVIIGVGLSYNDNTPVVEKGALPCSRDDMMTLTTPRGGTYQVTLSDGTKVWLNAASSLTYTADFSKQSERRVNLEGEAYFEVTKDKNHPFIVSSDKQEVKVLGTHFNINSYADETSLKTTLLEGSIQINGYILKPDQQAINQDGIIRVLPADIESVMAWKEGEFDFSNEALGSIMRKLVRWYDVEVYYDDPQMVNAKFWGTISRFKNISDVLRMLEKTNEVHFKIEGRRIMVMK